MKFYLELNKHGKLLLTANGVSIPGLTSIRVDSLPSSAAEITATFIVHPAMRERIIIRDYDGSSTKNGN